MRPLAVMFDLEDTIINSWNSCDPIPRKIKFIQNWLQNYKNAHSIKYDLFGCFSFAVDHEHEKQTARNILQNILQINISEDNRHIPCWTDLEKLIDNPMDSLYKYEIVNLYGKQRMFEIWTSQFPEFDFILFDDMLSYKDILIQRDSQTLRLIRVD